MTKKQSTAVEVLPVTKANKASQKRGSGRPKQGVDDEAAMRQRIVEVARQLFATQGFASVTLRNIATEVGCSPMWIYRYFDNKYAILRAVWEDFFVELFDQLNAIRHANPRTRLEQMSLRYLDYWLERPDRFRMVFLIEDPATERQHSYVHSGQIVDRFKPFESAVEQAREKGLFVTAKSGLVVQGLMCLLNGLALNLITVSELPWAKKSTLAPLAVNAYLDGFGPQSKRQLSRGSLPGLMP